MDGVDLGGLKEVGLEAPLERETREEKREDDRKERESAERPH